MTPIRKRLIEITAGLANDYAKTMDDLEIYVNSVIIAAKIEAYDSAIEKIKMIDFDCDETKTNILTGRSLDRSPETTPERMEGE